MTKNAEIVTIAADGERLGGWVSVEITAAINEAARAFSVVTTERIGEWKLPPGTAVDVYANSDLVVRGYTNRYKPRGNATQHQCTIMGRGKGQDIVDCAAVHDTSEWDDEDPENILRDLDKFGVGVKARVPLDKLNWRLAQGESVFRSGERLLRDQGVSCMGMPDGSIELTNASVAERHAGELAEGVNIEDYDGDIGDDQQHSDVTVKGQRSLGTDDDDIQIEETAKNPSVGRYRPRVIVSETDTNKKRARARAENEVERAAGASIKCRITTQGWRDEGGELWTPNRLIFVRSPILLKIVQDMLIERVLLKQDDKGGSLAELQLVDPRTYKGSSGKHGKSGKGWGFKHSTGRPKGASASK